MRKILLVLLLGLLACVGYLAFKTVLFSSKQLVVSAIDPIEISDNSLKHFIEAIRIKTVSPEDLSNFDSSAFRQFNAFIQQTYPLTDSLFKRNVFNDFSFLYEWKGSKPELKPIILMAHLDVVPVIEDNIPDWKEDPFGGKVVDGVVWGRGALDDKISVVGILEAVEMLLKDGFHPQRSIFISLGHDEEISGTRGAVAIAKYLKDQGVMASFVLDEGMTITQKMVPGIDEDVALIGIAEKGFTSLKLSVSIEGGHSSMPSRETAIDVLSNAISLLKKTPFPSRLSPPVKAFLDYLGPEMPLINKVVFANASIFESVVLSIYEQSSTGSALVRTTTAPTIFNSGVKENVIPKKASAIVNFRILPGETVSSVVERVKSTIDDDRISITTQGFLSEPSRSASTTSFGFEMLNRTIKEVYPEVLVAPSLVVGGTDSRHFHQVAENIYRFLPVHVSKENVKSYHGINERLPVSDFEDAIRFYLQLIKNSTE